MQNFSEKKYTFLSSKIILGTPSGRPGKPIRTQGGTDLKIWSKLGKFSSKKKSNFSRKFPYFLLPTFRKNPRDSIDFYEKKYWKIAHFFWHIFPKICTFLCTMFSRKIPDFRQVNSRETRAYPWKYLELFRGDFSPDFAHFFITIFFRFPEKMWKFTS